MLHTVGPIVRGRVTQRDREELASCYRACLELAAERGLYSVAFCCISTGEFHFPNREAAQIAVDTVRECLRQKTSIRRVIFNVFKDLDAEIYRGLLGPGSGVETGPDRAGGRSGGAGAGLSASAGLTYSGSGLSATSGIFKRNTASDMYSGGFFLDSLEEYWAWWSRHIWYNRYVDPPKPVYRDLLDLVGERDYFVLTTNVDHQFQRAGFDKSRIFYTQGDYGLWQCSKPCHAKTYDNQETVRRMLEEQRDMRVPAELVPYCPVCGRPMTMNLRADETFVEDEGWHAAARRYEAFLRRCQGKRVLFLSWGGGATPGHHQYPLLADDPAGPKGGLRLHQPGGGLRPRGDPEPRHLHPGGHRGGAGPAAGPGYDSDGRGGVLTI